jgi:UDP-N-acetylmuramoylalanine--D-glutamate ligase
LFELVKQNVKLILAFGETKDRIENEFSELKKVIKCNSLEDVVNIGSEYAEENDIVLLSPACKSFDMFKDYEHRGIRFKELVNGLR